MNWKEAVHYAKEHGATITDDGNIVISEGTIQRVIRPLSDDEEHMLVAMTPDGKYIISYLCSFIKELMSPVQKIDLNNIQNINCGINPIHFEDYSRPDWEMFKDWAVAIGAKDLDNAVKYVARYDSLTTREYTFDRNGEIWFEGMIFAKYRTPTQMRDILKGLLER